MNTDQEQNDESFELLKEVDLKIAPFHLRKIHKTAINLKAGFGPQFYNENIKGLAHKDLGYYKHISRMYRFGNDFNSDGK